MDRYTVFAVLELLSAAATVVLIFIGTSSAIKTLKADEEEGTESSARAARFYKRSFLFIGLGVLAYACTHFFMSYDTMIADGADTMTVVSQSIWEGIRSVGFLILVPVILRKWHPNGKK